jgi:hypothetical protein
MRVRRSAIVFFASSIAAFSGCSGEEPGSRGGIGAGRSGSGGGPGGGTAGSSGAGTGAAAGTAPTGGSAGGGADGGGAGGTGGSEGGVGGSNGSGSDGGGTGGGGAGGTGGGAGGTGGGGAGGAGGGGAGGTGGTGGDPPWPQCHAGDTMPANPTLTVDPAATGYTTAITNNGYVAMLIGPNRPSCLTDTVANRDLTDLNAALKHIIELVGFPAFPPWKNGHYMNWVILNSGIPGATLPNEGGYQGNRWGHMTFESTQENPCTWDTYNSGAALHETIHALQSELRKFNNRGSGWIHEAHNTYMGTMREKLAFNRYTMGYGAAGVLQAPHVPIESMGLLNDDTIGGPADQGAEGKSYVGGVYGVYRYGLEIFFMSLQLSMGRGFVNCLWMEAPDNNQESVFKVLEGYAGVDGVANAIMTFGTRNALLDFGEWTQTMRDLMRSRWQSLNNNWFYVFDTPDGSGWMSPPTKQLPHHEGRNNIPIRLDSGATEVVVELEPDASGSDGTPEKLLAQLVYRTPGDEPVYGARFSSGTGRVSVPNGARNDLVTLVIAVVNPFDAGNNSQYGYNLNEHFGYRVRSVSGGSLAPTSTTPW